MIVNFDPLFFGGDVDAASTALDAAWARLADRGDVLMPLGEYPFSPHYGWVQDRFGLTWQLMLTSPDGEPRPFVIPSLMFAGPAQNRAGEALDTYASVLPEAGQGNRFPYGTPTGPASAAALMFGEIHVGEQWIAAMDSAVEQDVTFSPGVSLEVSCRDQAEIDRIWAALSTVPEAEQCGWCVDQFGVSWQVVPDNIAELLERPGAFTKMLEMKKLVIAEF